MTLDSRDNYGQWTMHNAPSSMSSRANNVRRFQSNGNVNVSGSVKGNNLNNGNNGNPLRHHLDVNIDSRIKSEVWRLLKEFQSSSASSFVFPSTYTNRDRQYVHNVAKNLHLITKSQGATRAADKKERAVAIEKGQRKVEGRRFVVVYKSEEAAAKGVAEGLEENNDEDGQEEKQESKTRRRKPKVASFNEQLHSYLPLDQSIRKTIDAFFASQPLGFIETFDPFHPSRVATSSNQVSKPSSTLVSQPSHNNSNSLSTGRRLLLVSDPDEETLARREKMLPARRRLPIYSHRSSILSTIAANQVVVISSSTGSGKSTQVPQFLLEYENEASQGSSAGQIIISQPRRISAMTLADRVTAELGEENVGGTCGFQIRHEKAMGQDTRILFVTVGILLRRLVSDQGLKGVKYLVIDEVHERDRMCDFLLIVLRDLLPSHPHLKLILMSATINASLFSTYFSSPLPPHEPAPHLFIPGFTFPVLTFALEDVVELTGYDPEQAKKGLSGADRAKRKEATLMAKERELRKLLEQHIERQLFNNEAQPIELTPMNTEPRHHRLSSSITISKSSASGSASSSSSSSSSFFISPTSDEILGSSDSVVLTKASTVTLQRLADGMKPIDWEDSFVFKPSYDIDSFDHVPIDGTKYDCDKQDAPSAGCVELADELETSRTQGNDMKTLASIVSEGDNGFHPQSIPIKFDCSSNESSSRATASPTDADLMASLTALAEAVDSGAIAVGSEAPVSSATSPGRALEASSASGCAVAIPASSLSTSCPHPASLQPSSSSFHGGRYQHATLKHSESTLATIQQIEAEGMDYIDYDLVVTTIEYICTKYDQTAIASRSREKHNSGDEKKRFRQQVSQIDLDNGSILVFLSGWEDITRLMDMLSAHPLIRNNPTRFLLLPLHSSISTAQQRLIFQPPSRGQRKIILSTNVTSLNIAAHVSGRFAVRLLISHAQ